MAVFSEACNTKGARNSEKGLTRKLNGEEGIEECWGYYETPVRMT